jgi:imidazoleglycerol phosphate dehydratase HisB
MRSTCHLEALADQGSPGHTLALALAAAEAYGAALSRAIRIDPRRRGTVASSKGTLSK